MMALGFILDDLCVYAGVIVVWIAKGGKCSLQNELRKVERFDFFRRKEGVIGLAAIISLIALINFIVWGRGGFSN